MQQLPIDTRGVVHFIPESLYRKQTRGFCPFFGVETRGTISVDDMYQAFSDVGKNLPEPASFGAYPTVIVIRGI